MQRLVDDWTESGLLIPEQKDRILPDLQVNLRRTNNFLRVTLFVFGFMIVNALTGLFVVTLNLSEGATMYLAAFAAIAFFAVAQVLVQAVSAVSLRDRGSGGGAGVSFLVIAASMAFDPDVFDAAGADRRRRRFLPAVHPIRLLSTPASRRRCLSR